MDRYLVISSDCHAGLPPEQYRDYVDPKYRNTFDVALPIQIEETKKAAKKFLVADVNEEWRKGIEPALEGAWDHERRNEVLDGDGIAGEVIFPDGIITREPCIAQSIPRGDTLSAINPILPSGTSPGSPSVCCP